MPTLIEPPLLPLSASQIEDIKLASSKMTGAERRAFQAAMALKYCRGNARLAERLFGWGRATVQLGLNEHRTGVLCQGAQAAYSGNKRWEEKHPEVAEALWALVELHSQPDPTFRTPLSYTRLTAAEALKQLRAQGFQEDQLPSLGTMAEVLNRNGYRLRKVVKAKPQKKLPETDAIFDNIEAKDGKSLEDKAVVTVPNSLSTSAAAPALPLEKQLVIENSGPDMGARFELMAADIWNPYGSISYVTSGDAQVVDSMYLGIATTINLNIADKREVSEPLPGVVVGGQVKRISIDCKATVNIGEYSRGGKTRGDCRAADHDMGCQEKYIPFGLVDEDQGTLYITFGSSCKTSDFIVDNLEDWWKNIPESEQATISHLQIKVDNGPESSGVRTQFLKRMVELTDTIGKAIHLIYYPPYHSKYNPIERCWGILEQHWNGAKLATVETMLEWAKSMTWKGIQPVVKLSRTIYQKGISLSKKAMREIEARLERNPLLPKWDILIRPV